MLSYIANSKFSKVMSSFLAFLIFFSNVIFPTQALALTGGPSQQEFNSFDPAGASEMVNLFTGDFSYNIPLMDVDGYPLNIAYHASPGMDQEASWVGLGWNINAGAINRGMRGLPDDFNGDPVHKDLNIEPYKAWGVSTGYFGELAGLKTPVSVSGSGGMGVFHSNYSGFGIEISNSNTFGVSAGSKVQGGLTAGLGVKLSSQDGTDIYPQLGISAKLAKTNRTSSVGVNIGCSINSRDGLKSINGGFSISSQRTQKPTGVKNADGSDAMTTNSGGKGIGMGVTSSASIPASSQGYMPKMIANMSSQAYNLDFKMGVNGCVYSQGGYISGYYAQNGINDSQKNKDYSTFGYLFSQNASDNDMLDFNREKDGMMYPELPNMPIANYTYDMFSASAQGLNYAFRPHRNDVGILRDNSTIDNSFGLGIGAELMFSTDLNVGLNINVMFSDGESGRWKDDNDFNRYSDFTKHDLNSPSYEPVYFKVAGEKNEDDNVFLNSVTNTSDDAYRVKLSKKTSSKYAAAAELVNKYGTNPATTLSGVGALAKAKRATRNELVSYLNATEAAKYAVDQKILSYPELNSSSFLPTAFNNTIIRTSASGPENIGEFVAASITKTDRDGSFCGGRTHHISETSITQNNGSRYIYGIPMYNRKQTEAMFNVGESLATNAVSNSSSGNMQKIEQGLIKYSSSDASPSNAKGIDHFCEKTTIGDYSHGFLLTSILSSDYVDLTGNGPSTDDYGDYTKFNYTQIVGNGAYKWRTPAEQDYAKFNQGLLGDRNDNKGVYIYGEKDLWYTQSIETKNYIAFFVLNNDRKDAFPVSDDQGGNASTNLSRSLKEIRLYAKKDFANGGIANAKPIKIVNFEYDYSLCYNTPNSNAPQHDPSNTASVKGKLTLKKIWFTYSNSQKGKSSPYVFDYADIDHNGVIDGTHENPAYNSAAIDRWGAYKPNVAGALNNLDFPYVNQNDADVSRHAAAWSLTQIKTPAGSTIKVTYEADDYAYIQNKEAGQMFKVAGLNSSPNFVNADNKLYDPSTSREYLIVDLTSIDPGAGVLNDAEFKSKYLKELEKIYFRFKIDMDNKATNYEFVPGYAEIDKATTQWAGVCTDGGTYQVNSTGPNFYKYAYIKLKLLGINDKDQSNPLVSPIVKAGFQMGRMYLPQIVFPGSQPASGNGNAIKGLVTTIKDAKYLLKGINKALYERKIAKTCELAASVVRLYNPGGFKKGGGSRVSKITINDNWNTMTNEAGAEYGQEYSYTTKRNGAVISSGVASYEPLLGGDENSMRYPVDFAIKKTFAPNDEYFQEEPMGESFFPDALVGYSKITVRNIPKTGVTVHGTGTTEYEFFTAKDYPVVTDRTDLQKQRVKPKLLQSILKFGSTDKLYLSQGYVIKTNDMHGKLKSQKMFAEGSVIPISGINYHYKSKTGIKSIELDNSVNVIDKTNTISSKTIGKTTDFYSDSRSSVNDVYTAGVSININSASCTYYVPLVFVWPSFGHEHREFKSMGTTKLIQQYGLIDYVEAFENSSTVKTKNLLYDDISGEVLLTETTNDFDDPVYNLKYPGYWAYEDMGAAFINAGIRIPAASVDASTGKLINHTSFFRPGDEVGIFDPLDHTYTKKGWIIENKAGGTNGNGLFLVDKDGLIIQNIQNATHPLAASYMKILRSGRRNLQSAPMASLLSLKNPVIVSGAPAAPGVSLAGGALNATSATGVISSSAVEYSNIWHLLLGINTTFTPGQTLIPSTVNMSCGKFVGDIINPYVENIRGNWRVKKSYSYLTDRMQKNQSLANMNGDIREDGIYTTFTPFWNYSAGNWKTVNEVFGSYDKWIKNNEVDKINEYGNVLYARDVLNRPSASLYGYNHTLPVAAANNAFYNQLAFDGFEDYDFINNECSSYLTGTTAYSNPDGYIEHFNYYNFKSQRTAAESHTGRFSIRVPSSSSVSSTRPLTDPNPPGTADNEPYTIKHWDNYGLFGPYYSYSQPQKFVLSVWAKEQYVQTTTQTTPVIDYAHVGVSVWVNGTYVSSSTPKKSAIINGWQKLEYEFTVAALTPYFASGGIKVALNNTSTNAVYYDDIRIHPFNSSMKSMVYDPYSLRLMAELDDRNYATLYEYDDEGTLVRIKKETEKGIFTIKESRSGLKK